MDELPLTGGRVTRGVLRVGDTVRRPPKPNSPFVRVLLTHLHARGFAKAPRYLGTDDRGREVFSFQPGEVPHDLDSTFPDGTLVAAAQLIREYHDVTAGTDIAGDSEVICHNDLSPCNFVFRDGRPVGLLDFDSAAPGARSEDIGYAIFLWLNLGTDGPPPDEQARRITVFCRAYGVAPNDRVISAVVDAVAKNIERLRADGRFADVEWWQAQLAWLDQNRVRLVELLA